LASDPQSDERQTSPSHVRSFPLDVHGRCHRARENREGDAGSWTHSRMNNVKEMTQRRKVVSLPQPSSFEELVRPSHDLQAGARLAPGARMDGRHSSHSTADSPDTNLFAAHECEAFGDVMAEDIRGSFGQLGAIVLASGLTLVLWPRHA